MKTRLIVAVIALVVAALGTSAAIAASSSVPPLPSADPFYSYSGSLTAVAPGTVLKVRTVALVGFAANTETTATEVLYRTTNQLGGASDTAAMIIRAGSASNKLVSYQTAYDSLGPECDPTYAFQGGDPTDNSTNADEEKIIQAYVTAGDTVVIPDYEGPHEDWTAGQEAGYGTLDGIRAAESALQLPVATTPVAMVGYSGGSIATDYAAELAETYAPALHIVGIAIGGVPVDFQHNLDYINGSSGWSGIMPATLTALAQAFRVSLTPYLSSYGETLAQSVAGQCLGGFYGAHPGLRYQQMFKPAYQDIYSIRPVARIVNKLIMSRTGTPTAPVFIGVGNADGTGDGVMVAADDQELAHVYCSRGVPVQFTIFRGQTHTQAAVLFEPAALTFLTARLDGISTANGCASIAAGDSIDPLPVPAAPKPKHHKRRAKHHQR